MGQKGTRVIQIMLVENSTCGIERGIGFNFKGFVIIRNEEDREIGKVFLEVLKCGISIGGPLAVPVGRFRQ